MLMGLWASLMGDRKLKARESTEWVDIGFQGKDPATDFRGAGILGLEQLVAITENNSEYRDLAIKMHKDSAN